MDRIRQVHVSRLVCQESRFSIAGVGSGHVVFKGGKKLRMLYAFPAVQTRALNPGPYGQQNKRELGGIDSFTACSERIKHISPDQPLLSQSFFLPSSQRYTKACPWLRPLFIRTTLCRQPLTFLTP